MLCLITNQYRHDWDHDSNPNPDLILALMYESPSVTAHEHPYYYCCCAYERRRLVWVVWIYQRLVGNGCGGGCGGGQGGGQRGLDWDKVLM